MSTTAEQKKTSEISFSLRDVQTPAGWHPKVKAVSGGDLCCCSDKWRKAAVWMWSFAGQTQQRSWRHHRVWYQLSSSCSWLKVFSTFYPHLKKNSFITGCFIESIILHHWYKCVHTQVFWCLSSVHLHWAGGRRQRGVVRQPRLLQLSGLV